MTDPELEPGVAVQCYQLGKQVGERLAEQRLRQEW